MLSYQIVRSKMKKTGVLLADTALACYIPKTEFYTPGNLEQMLKEHCRVYVKPDRGRGGKKVISVVMEKAGLCRIHYQTRILKAASIDKAAAFVESVTGNSRFIIQQGINLLRIDGNPFDIRVNVQKPYETWEVTAVIAKVAQPEKAVSNYSQGGTLVKIDQALELAGLTKNKVKETRSQLNYLGEKAASALVKEYPGLRELGLDIGLDQNAWPWILEVNTLPQYPRGLSKKFDRYRQIIMLETFGGEFLSKLQALLDTTAYNSRKDAKY